MTQTRYTPARRAADLLTEDLVPVDGRPDRESDREVTIFLPWTEPPLSMNDRGATRGATMARADTIKDIRYTLMVLLKRHRLAKGSRYIDVQLHYLPATNRRRDTDNLVATLKPVADAIAAGTKKYPGYGVVPDDTPEWMGKPEPIIYHRPPGAPPKLWLTLQVWDRETKENA